MATFHDTHIFNSLVKIDRIQSDIRISCHQGCTNIWLTQSHNNRSRSRGLRIFQRHSAIALKSFAANRNSCSKKSTNLTELRWVWLKLQRIFQLYFRIVVHSAICLDILSGLSNKAERFQKWPQDGNISGYAHFQSSSENRRVYTKCSFIFWILVFVKEKYKVRSHFGSRADGGPPWGREPRRNRSWKKGLGSCTLG